MATETAVMDRTILKMKMLLGERRVQVFLRGRVPHVEARWEYGMGLHQPLRIAMRIEAWAKETE